MFAPQCHCPLILILVEKFLLNARASYIPGFEKEMELLNSMSEEGHAYMKKIDPHHWCRAYFQSQFKCDVLLNNLCERFNQILGARAKGIITMNKMTSTKLIIRIRKNRDAM